MPWNVPVVVIGGLGGDSHSVGLIVLRDALRACGYRVRDLGIQNRIGAFVGAARGADAVLVSCMDGHADHYLAGFTVPRRTEAGARRPVWYLGGNPALGEPDPSPFLAMGFDRVFMRFTPVAEVRRAIEADLGPRRIRPDRAGPAALSWNPDTFSDERLDTAAWEREREEVLRGWPTGADARDLEANARELAARPRLAELQRRASRPLVQPRSGVPLVEEQLAHFLAYRRAGADVLSFQIDSLTRNNDYAGAARAVAESARDLRPRLNGFPLVNHGAAAVRRIARSLDVPLQIRHSTRDPRLLAEIGYAGGVAAYEGGAICYNLPYYRDYPLPEAIRRWRYVDRLTGLYAERFGLVLDREFFGTLTATLVPPCLAIATGVLEALFAAQQGVRSVSLGYAEQGHRIQDVAAVRVLRDLAEEALAAAGHAGVRVGAVFHQYMAAFPDDPARAEELIFESAVTAGLSGATRILVKSPAEARDIPRVEDNVRAIELVRRGLAAAERSTVDERRVAEEAALIRAETVAILEAVAELGAGRLDRGVVEAFRAGVLDIPFSPSRHNRGEVRTARDLEGAVRFLDCGRLPFGREIRAFHGDAMHRRRVAEGLRGPSEDHLLIERDTTRIAEGRYDRWPLGGAAGASGRAATAGGC
ncbi:MAG: methylaspartate mutase subunit E [Acidobacteria bacterium]|nr:MAG: methylaspartate mutase subunit E [Acidobacteriota bacterium]